MASDQTNIKLTSNKSQTSDDSEKLFAAYDAVSSAEEALDKIDKSIENVIPKKIDYCNIQDVIGKVDEIAVNIANVQETMVSAVNGVLSDAVNAAAQTATNAVNAAENAAEKATNKAVDKAKEKTKKKKSKNNETENNEENTESNETENNEGKKEQQLTVDQKYTKYLATQIILKKFQLIKYKVEMMKLNLNIMVASLTKSVLTAILGGKGSAQDPINQTMVTTVSSAAQTVNTIMTVISSIVSMINSVTIMNVNGAGMAFFPTPKSITKTDINVLNARQSTTNIIPEAVDKAISQAEQKIRESNGKLKQTKVAAMAAKGSSSAASGKFDPGSFGSLPKFDPSIIRTAVKMLLQALTDAEAVPRYEKLSIANVRFLFFLVTGFEPAGKKTFGIPGFP